MGNACAGKVALVAGASQGGTGTGSAVRLAAEGASVAICARTVSKMRDTLDQIHAVGGRGVMCECDLSQPHGGRDTLVARTEEAFGPIDYLVYVAAGGGYNKFETISQDQIQTALELNIKAPWLLNQHAVASMRARSSGGAIVNIGTKAAHRLNGPPYDDIPPATAGTLYGGSKAALHRFSQGVAAETYGQGISVNVLSPLAAIGTPNLRAAGWIPEEMFEPVETMVESVIALLTGDPMSVTGMDVFSIQLLHDLQRPVYDFSGTKLIEGWQPEDLPRYLAARATTQPLSFEGQARRSVRD